MLKQSFIRNRLNTFTFSSTVCHFLLNELREKGLQRLPFWYWRFTWIAIFYIHFALSLKLRLKIVKFKKGKTAITYLFSSNQCLAPIETDEEHWQSQHHPPSPFPIAVLERSMYYAYYGKMYILHFKFETGKF